MRLVPPVPWKTLAVLNGGDYGQRGGELCISVAPILQFDMKPRRMHVVLHFILITAHFRLPKCPFCRPMSLQTWVLQEM